MELSESKFQWESEPLTTREDREVFFACRKLWVEGKDEEKQVVDQARYDTASFQPIDIFPYLVTMGYATEKNRMEVSLRQLANIKQLRAKYGINELSEVPWQPDWNFKCVSNEEMEKEWPLYIQGADNDGRVILWDKSGNVDFEWLRKNVQNPEGLEALKFYVVKQAENLLRAKVGISSKMKCRMVKHVGVVDTKGVKLGNANKIKTLTGQILKDMQSMYPNTLQKLYIINAGWPFKAAWKVIRMFLHPETARKIDMVGSKYQDKLKEAGITDYPQWIS